MWQRHCQNKGGEKSGKLFCGNGIAEIEGKKQFAIFFFPSISASQFLLEMIRPQHFYNFFTTNPKWQDVTDYYYWGKKIILVLGSNLNL